ncbi:MAG: endolytic transglycosylase MltG [Clostridia bacterium]|nr:endolytic transglycosylase MltG [Clostridia bacterium]
MAENKKRGGVRRVRKIMNTFSYIVLIVGISLLLSTVIILVANDVLALVKPEREVVLDISGSSTPAEMAEVLKENGLIQYKWAFSLMSRLKHIDEYKGGKFSVRTNMDYGQIIDALTRVATYQETTMVTIPEGYTISQIAELVEDKMVCSAEDFIETANTYKFSHEILKEVPMRENRLEGYLFPDTYEFYINDKPVSVINKMLNNFVKKYTREMLELTETQGMTVAEVVNIASMIEKEAKLDTERTMISGVIRNRLDSDSFPFLNIDATILYATGHKSELTDSDLRIDSPYNTYTHEGLPPTAICNPGTSSLVAALMPEEHGYYYYVLDPDTGGHVFSKTLEEHNAAVAEMRAKR